MAEYKRKIWLTVALMILGVIMYVYSAIRPTVETVSVHEEVTSADMYAPIEASTYSQETSIEETNDSAFPVYICGQICMPGIYQLEHPIYLYELIELAGGLTEEADQDHINMVYVIEEAQSIYVPSVNDVTGEISSNIMQDGRSGAKHENDDVSGVLSVNINEADIDELCLLPGIGTKTAEKIIEYREKNGAFTSIEQIKNISGIGDAKYEQIRENIHV